jgi:glycosyltransferase involved in cell wall biosynthesis
MIVSCIVNPFFGGGIARHTREMIGGLAGRPGFECRLLASSRDLAARPRFLDDFRGMAVQSLPLPVQMMDRVWKATGWPPADRFVRGSDVLYSPAHGRLPTKAIPTVMTVHDIQAFETDLPWSDSRQHRLFRAKWASWLPKAGRECARILTVSEFSKRRLTELVGIDPAKIGVVGNGVSECFFTAGQRTPKARHDRVVVVGGIRTTKGAADTLAVARELARIRSPLVITVVGQNDPEWAAKAEGMANVKLAGAIGDDELATMLASSVALLFLTPYEGFGIPAVEAMAAGVPPVVSNRASLPEIVGDAGLVVDPSQHAAIAGMLERLRDEKEFRSRWVKTGLEHARNFTWPKCVERLARELEYAVVMK